MCTYEGFPLVALPGANVFFTDRDVTSSSRGISCKRIPVERAVYDLVKAGRLLVRLAELI